MILVKRDSPVKTVPIGVCETREEEICADGSKRIRVTRRVMYETVKYMRPADISMPCAVVICRRRCCKDSLAVVEDAAVCARCAVVLRVWIRLRAVAETVCRLLERHATAEGR